MRVKRLLKSNEGHLSFKPLVGEAANGARRNCKSGYAVL